MKKGRRKTPQKQWDWNAPPTKAPKPPPAARPSDVPPPEPPPPPPPPEPEPVYERVYPGTPTERATIILFGLFVAVLILLGAYFTDNRTADIDELVMHCPAYMLSHWGRLTHPAEGFFNQPVLAHPPLHLGLIGLLERAGMTWYYAEGTPTALVMLLTVWIIVTGSFTPPVKLGLLVGLGLFAATGFLFVALHGSRPDAAVHSAWFAGMLLLESGRLNHWSRGRLFGGAFLLMWASCLHYYAAPAIAGALVYMVWAVRSLGWRWARPRLLVVLGGAALFLVPYVALYVIPYWHDLVQTIRQRGLADTTGPSSIGQTLDIYRQWANWSTIPRLFRFAMMPGIPLLLFTTPLLAAVKSTRGIAMASLPLLTAILLFATHKRAVYLVHEIQLFGVALAVAGIVLVDWLSQRPTVPPWCRHAFLPSAALLLGWYVVSEQVAFARPVFSTRPQVHEADVARAANRDILGPNARVAALAGAWYTGGGGWWHEMLYDLVYNKDADPKSYLSKFDAVANYLYRSGECPKDTQRTASYWFSTGMLKLRGFYISVKHPEISIVLTSLQRPPKIAGYAMRGGRLYRFDESEPGQYEVIAAACPARPELDYNDFAYRYPQVSASVLELPPGPPGSPNFVLTVLAPRSASVPIGLLERFCAPIHRVRGDIKEVDHGALVDQLRRHDTPIHFVETFQEMPGSRQQ